jgi:hypothetical protein
MTLRYLLQEIPREVHTRPTTAVGRLKPVGATQILVPLLVSHLYPNDTRQQDFSFYHTGGVIGGLLVVALLGILAWFLLRRRRRGTKIKEAPVDLLDTDTRQVQPAEGRQYIPEPFHIPDSERAGSETSGPGSYLGIGAPNRRESAYSEGRVSSEGSSAPQSSAPTKNAAALSGLRPVNIIQHEDAGPSATSPPAETVELPPAYTNIRS